MGDLLKYEDNANYTRESVTLLAGTNYALGSVLGIVTASGKYTLSPDAGATGEQVAVAVLLEAVDATAADATGLILARGPAIVSKAQLVFDATPLQQWLAWQHAKGATVCSVCAGAFWLGHAGLLDRRPATTHWALEDEFRDTFPSVELHPEHILVDDGDIVTAGGIMAWLDLGLFLVERRQGAEIVMQTARHLLIDPAGREQKNYRSFCPNLTHGDSSILKVQRMLAAGPQDNHGIARLAGMAGLSSRTFQRRFRSATGLTPSAYIRSLRIEKARGLLERTRLSVNEIAWRMGYQDVTAFGRVFYAVTGLTASEYRTRFSVLETIASSRRAPD